MIFTYCKYFQLLFNACIYCIIMYFSHGMMLSTFCKQIMAVTGISFKFVILLNLWKFCDTREVLSILCYINCEIWSKLNFNLCISVSLQIDEWNVLSVVVYIIFHIQWSYENNSFYGKYNFIIWTYLTVNWYSNLWNQ